RRVLPGRVRGPGPGGGDRREGARGVHGSGGGPAGRRPRGAGVGVDALLRELAPQVLTAVVRRHGDFDACEDAVQEALLAAATQWPVEGLPDHPKGWLITVASRRRTEPWRSDSARQRRGAEGL